MKLTKETLQNLLARQGDTGGIEIVKDEFVEGFYSSVDDPYRFSSRRRLTFKTKDGACYQIGFSRGLTDSKKDVLEAPDVMECPQVFPVEKTIIVYEALP